MRIFSLVFVFIASLLRGDISEYQFFGKHFIASYMECDEEALNDIKTLGKVMHEAAEASGATVLSSSEYVFPPYGFTMVLLLSESHASIHTYPEYRACFVDLFTCGETCDATQFARVLETYLKPSRSDKQLLTRKEP